MITFLEYLTEGSTITGTPAKEVEHLTNELIKSVYKSEYTFNTTNGPAKFTMNKKKHKAGKHNTADSISYSLFLNSKDMKGKRLPIADISLSIHPVSGAKGLSVTCWALADLDKVKSLVSTSAKRIFSSEKFDIHVKHRSGKGDYDEVSAQTQYSDEFDLEEQLEEATTPSKTFTAQEHFHNNETIKFKIPMKNLRIGDKTILVDGKTLKKLNKKLCGVSDCRCPGIMGATITDSQGHTWKIMQAWQ